VATKLVSSTTGDAEQGALEGPPNGAAGSEFEESFLSSLLAVLSATGPADVAVAITCSPNDAPRVIVEHAGSARQNVPTVWLGQATSQCAKSLEGDHSIVTQLSDPNALYDDSKSSYVLSAPLKLTGFDSYVLAFLTPMVERKAAERIRRRIELGLSTFQATGALSVTDQADSDPQSLRNALEILSAFNLHSHFGSASLALCNEASAKWQCERVSLGIFEGTSVRVKTISHTSEFSRKMQAVKDMESAMEECLDQDCETIHPPPPDAAFVSRAVGEFANLQAPLAVLNLPVRKRDEIRGVLTLERPVERPFLIQEIESIRLALELCSARMLDLHDQDRWIGAKLASGMRKGFATILGPTHTWIKLTVILISAALIAPVFIKGDYRADGICILEPLETRIVSAPFDSYIKSVDAEVGDTVVAGETVLARLDTEELQLQLSAAKSEQAAFRKEADTARRDNETAMEQIAQANANKMQAQIDLLEYNLNRAEIKSPLNGITVVGDLRRRIGAPVQTGEVLFEVSPLESLRAIINVSEDQISDISVGLRGELATASYPAIRIPFEVERIDPVATVANQNNVFEVRLKLDEIHPWMRPGMEGVGKIDVDRRSYSWIWSRKVVNWVRMKLWL
jgi:hypothetical protein